MKKSLFALLLASAGLFAADDEITIALAGPVTGAVTQYGTMQKIGAVQAIEDLNAKGGMNGKKINYKIYDDGCEGKQAVTVANQIVNDGVKFVIGHLCSGGTLAAAPIYNEEGIVMITAASTSPELSQKGYETIFRTIGTDLQSAPASADYIAKVKPKKIALIHDKQAYGQGLVEELQKLLKEKGVEVAILEGVTAGQTDFSALITKLKSAGVDFVYWGGYYPELGLIIRQGAEQGIKPTYMGADGIDNPDIFTIAGKEADGLLATVPRNFSSLPENKSILDAMSKKKEDGTGPFVMPAYAATKVVIDAANLAKSNEPADVAKAIKGNSFDTPIGKISFQENGDLKDFQSVVYELKSDGSRTLKSE